MQLLRGNQMLCGFQRIGGGHGVALIIHRHMVGRQQVPVRAVSHKKNAVSNV
jgi:hypothetical protein